MPECVISSMDQDGNVSHHNIDNISIEQANQFTLDDLVEYYYHKFPSTNRNKKRDIGALKYLISRYGVDKLLFIIDASSLFFHEEDKIPPQTPLEITKYEHYGILAYKEKRGYQEWNNDVR